MLASLRGVSWPSGYFSIETYVFFSNHLCQTVVFRVSVERGDGTSWSEPSIDVHLIIKILITGGIFKVIFGRDEVVLISDVMETTVIWDADVIPELRDL